MTALEGDHEPERVDGGRERERMPRSPLRLFAPGRGPVGVGGDRGAYAVGDTAGVAPTALLGEVMGVGLKPLTISQTPSENSNAATGSAARAVTGDSWGTAPMKTAMSEASSSGAPTRAMMGKIRGTRPERYSM